LYKNKNVTNNLKILKLKNGGMAELANVALVHPRDPGSNIGKDKISLILFVSVLKSNL
jgi:hypothetical protein